MQKNSKDSKVIILSKKSMNEFNKIGKRVAKRWAKEVTKKGINGNKLLNIARASILKNEK
jgi:hypothetical protein